VTGVSESPLVFRVGVADRQFLGDLSIIDQMPGSQKQRRAEQ
jgi:hypothetical protein